MENKELYNILSDNVTIKITGNNVHNFIFYLIKMKIYIDNVKYNSNTEVTFITTFGNYKKILSLKNIYDVKVVRFHGKLRIKEIFYLNKILFVAIICGYIMLNILANIIFDIEVVHNNAKIREELIKDLSDYNIKPLKFKKGFQKIEEIETELLKKHKDNIEWLEITEVGTKYIVRLEERKKTSAKQIYPFQDIISNNNAIIKKIFAEQGEILKNVNDYVKKGDVLITGILKNGEKIMSKVPALGEVYGEVWYEVKVEVPFHYIESYETGNSNKVLCLYFLNKKWELFNVKKYKKKKTDETVMVNNLLSPFKITWEKQIELENIDFFYTEGEAISKALEIGRRKIEGNFDTKEKILNEKVLNFNVNGSKMIVDIFYVVYKNIGMPKKIVEEIEIEE
ncbi:MAG: sporulation protein YqfD [Bacilli bacterium]